MQSFQQCEQQMRSQSVWGFFFPLIGIKVVLTALLAVLFHQRSFIQWQFVSQTQQPFGRCTTNHAKVMIFFMYSFERCHQLVRIQSEFTVKRKSQIKKHWLNIESWIRALHFPALILQIRLFEMTFFAALQQTKNIHTGTERGRRTVCNVEEVNRQLVHHLGWQQPAFPVSYCFLRMKHLRLPYMS